MATTTTIGAVKRGLITELAALLTITDTATASTYVQVAYGVPAADRHRTESLYFRDDARTVTDPEQRLTAGRRTRIVTWEFELVASAAVTADTSDAEARALVIAAAAENWLAANPQPAEWANAPVATGALHLLLGSMHIDHTETVVGAKRVEVTMGLEMKERLT